MSRTVSLVAGLLAVAAITYKFRDDLTSNTADIRRRLDNAKTTLDHVAAGTASQSLIDSKPGRPPLSFLGQSQHYVSNRLIPSVKDSWNAHVTSAAHAIINVDISSHVKKIWDDKIAPNFEK